MFDQVIIEMIKMKQRNVQRGYDWTQAFVKPEPVRLSLIDRVLPVIGDSLIRVGNKMKQRSHSRLTADHAQTPNFLIML
ncbi:MAG: hypothetical protein ACM3H7_00050 [Acidobacteriaceae bacterium]